jgi:hypothetical protein
MTFETWWEGAKRDIRAQLVKDSGISEAQASHAMVTMRDVATAAYIVGGDSFAEYLRASLPGYDRMRN